MRAVVAWASAAVCLTSLLAAPAAGQQSLTLRNGDRLTGALTGIDAGAWIFRHAAGELKVPGNEIAGFAAPQPIGIRLADGSIVAATVTTTGSGLALAAADGTTRTASPVDFAAVGSAADLASLRPVRIGYFTPFRRFWGATASLGFSDKSGNSRNRGLTAELELGRQSPKDRLAIKVGVAREESDPGSGALETTVEKYYGSARADVFFGSRIFAFAATAQERDEFQDIDLRSNYNAGLGVQIIATNETDLRFYSSGGLRREAFTSGAASSSTAILAAGTALRRSLGPAVFAWTVDLAPSLDDLDDYRLVSEASITTTVFRGLGFRVASRNELNNRPPPDIEKHDMLVTTTLTYTIGR